MTTHKTLCTVPAAVLAAALALAGCGSGDNALTLEKTDPLREARQGAMEADEAREKVKGILLIQTGGGKAGEYAMKARQAADKARKAYETAKAESDKATGTDSVRVATLAETVRTQAALAVEEANRAMAAAMNRMHLLHVEGMTYKLGDTTITAGPDNNTSQENLLGNPKMIVTRTTGKLVGTEAKAGSFLESEVSSPDGNARLIVVSQYAKPKKANVWHTRGWKPDSAPIIVNGSTVDKDNPYGTLPGISIPIKRAEGEFYEVVGLEPVIDSSKYDPDSDNDLRRIKNLLTFPDLTNANLSKVKVVANAKEDNAEELTGIYYFIPTSNFRSGTTRVTRNAGERQYLKRSNRLDRYGAKGLHFYYITAVKDVTFPVATPYDYMNYGTWVSYKDDKPSDLGIGFVRALSDTSLTAEMPITGTATYKGAASAYVRAAHAQGEGAITHEYVATEMTANFARNTIQVDLDTLGNLEGTIAGNRFSGSKISGVTHSALTSGATFTVEEFRGAFFGPGVEEAGGVFDVTSEGGKAGAFRGAFGGRKAE